MIKNTYQLHSDGILSAYKDNAAVLTGTRGGRFYVDPKTNEYAAHDEDIHILCKVETHNHPTAISPFPGAATGSGGEIRDEGATGRGAKPKAGLTGFTVSNLKLPGAHPAVGKGLRQTRPHRLRARHHDRRPARRRRLQQRIRPPRDQRLLPHLRAEVPAAQGQGESSLPSPKLQRHAQRSTPATELRGYHKPIMLAGGLGNIQADHVKKGAINPGDKLIVLGGPAMLIGLGGGAASSMASGSGNEDLDFASVQRDNAEMERRCQEVIDRCWALGDDNPISFIHDVGAGGISNALPELVNDGGRGGRFQLRAVPNDEPGMSPARDLVQRIAGTLRPRRARRAPRRLPTTLRTRTLPLRRRRRSHRGKAARPRGFAFQEHARSTCRSRSSSANRRACTARTRRCIAAAAVRLITRRTCHSREPSAASSPTRPSPTKPSSSPSATARSAA